MVYTITFNPALDYIVTVGGEFKVNKTNRTTSEYMLAGGKGINVSILLNNLGVDTVALGFIAGFVGDEIKRRVSEEYGVKEQFIKLPRGNSRINMKIRDINGTEVNGMGPDISEEAVEELMDSIRNMTADDTLVLAGSIPPSLPQSIYETIIKETLSSNVKIVVDATKALLLNTLKYKPFLIKPNKDELEEMFGTAINTTEEVIKYAKELNEMGAQNVIISMGGDGAVFVNETETYIANVPRGTIVNTVGCGDSMIAGFIAKYTETENAKEAFKYSTAAGSASAFSENLATKDEIEIECHRISIM